MRRGFSSRNMLNKVVVPQGELISAMMAWCQHTFHASSGLFCQQERYYSILDEQSWQISVFNNIACNTILTTQQFFVFPILTAGVLLLKARGPFFFSSPCCVESSPLGWSMRSRRTCCPSGYMWLFYTQTTAGHNWNNSCLLPVCVFVVWPQAQVSSGARMFFGSSQPSLLDLYYVCCNNIQSICWHSNCCVCLFTTSSNKGLPPYKLYSVLYV